MMMNKVSIDLFLKFGESPRYRKLLDQQAKGKPWVVKYKWREWARDWQNKQGKASRQLPVMQVTVIEAYCFARWLGGNLPEISQWDKAAGREDQQGRKGPFLPGWKRGDNKGIGIGRADEGPLPVGTAALDESVFMCRDMAGNGLEWTRDMASNRKKLVPLENPGRSDLVACRGRNYKETSPLLFSEFDQKAEAEEYQTASDEIGFRVMIELP
jgi:formylglycine-generating enzyme required for sulfatase activity